MFDGFISPWKALVESRPQIPNQSQVPLGLWQLENFFEALKQIVGCQFVTGIQRPGEERADAIPGSVQLSRIKSKIAGRGLFRLVAPERSEGGFRVSISDRMGAKVKL